MYVREGDTEPLARRPAPGVAMSVCVAGVLVLGLFPEPILQAASTRPSALFGG